MAKTVVTKSFVLVTAPDTNDNEIEFGPVVIDNDANQLIWVEVKTGSFQFRVGAAVNADTDIPTIDSDDGRVMLAVSNKNRNLHYKATTLGDTFLICLLQ